MELKEIGKKLNVLSKKYGYFIVILIIGVVFLTIPSNKEKEDTHVENAEATVNDTVNEQLSNILSYIDGVGNVRVFLTIAQGQRTIYQTDEDVSTGENTDTTHIKTIIVTDSDREETGLVQQVNPPVYLGAIVVCDGADNTSVRLDVVSAVSSVTGLGADRITVLKMK